VADEVDVITIVVGGIDVVVLEDVEVEVEVEVELDDVVVEVDEVVVVVDDDDVVELEVDVLLVVLVVLVLVGGRVVEVDEMEDEVELDDVGFGDTAANIE
jgi:hypothetical protein